MEKDPPLTPLGVRQAQETGRFFLEYIEKHAKPDLIVIECSPFLRTLMTGLEIAKVLGVKKISVNSLFCEWMSKKLFDETQLRGLMIKQGERGQASYTDYLACEGIEIDYSDPNFEEALKFYPETGPEC